MKLGLLQIILLYGCLQYSVKPVVNQQLLSNEDYAVCNYMYFQKRQFFSTTKLMGLLCFCELRTNATFVLLMTYVYPCQLEAHLSPCWTILPIQNSNWSVKFGAKNISLFSSFKVCPSLTYDWNLSGNSTFESVWRFKVVLRVTNSL